VGSDADVRTEHVHAAGLVARAVAAVAVADASRASEPSSVHGEGESALCRPNVRVSHSTSAPAPAVDCLPASSLPAVNYSLPKMMGSALGWTDVDRVPLCEAYLEVTSDPVNETARTKNNLRETVHEVGAEKMRNKGPLRVGLFANALAKQFKRIRAGVSSFTTHYLAFKAVPTTENPPEKDTVSGAVARYCSLDLYNPMRADLNQDKASEKTRKRKAKVAHCEWVS